VGAKLGSGGGPMADINVTPLIDVVLVLLVVFMVVTPMLQSGMPVALPKASQTTQVNDVGQFIVVSITNNQEWYVEQELVTEDTIIAAINAEFRKNPSRSILVKGDRELAYKDVRKAMDVIAENGLTTMLIGAEKRE
jgi:biopolymer transport protein ExbD/biopolymer transport protein TolR